MPNNQITEKYPHRKAAKSLAQNLFPNLPKEDLNDLIDVIVSAAVIEICEGIRNK